VLLHGGPGSTHHEFHPFFTKAKNFARIILYDQRGCGNSDYVPGKGYTFEQAIEDLEKLRKTLNIDKWVVLGHSYGGFLAQGYAIKYPENLLGLILVASLPPHDVDSPIDNERQMEYISEDEKKKLDEIREDVGKKITKMAQLVYNLQINGDWKRQSYYRPSKEKIAQIALYEWKQDKNFNRIMSESFMNFDLQSSYIEKLSIPMLLIEGKWDLTWNEDKATAFHKVYPKSHLVILDKSGHNPFGDEPGRFFDLLKEFIDSVKLF
jgi:proline iminopeptidase